MRDGRYTELAPLGKGTFARVIGAVDSGPGGGKVTSNLQTLVVYGSMVMDCLW